MKNWMTFLMIGCIAFSLACGEDQDGDKPEAPTPNLVDGKADGSSVIARGALGFGEDGALQNSIPNALQFDAYELEMAAGGVATIEISQKGTSRGFDSLLFLYGPRDESGQYSSGIIARDDDAGWGLLSRIRDFEVTESGTYMLVVGSYEGEGQYRIYAECENGACEPEAPTGECVFGSSYGDLVRGAPAMTITYQGELSDAAEFNETQQSQLVASLQYAGFTDVTSIEDALNTVDEGRVNLLHVWDVSNQRAYEVFEYALGDTSVGTVYAAGTTERAAVISDLDFYDCVAFRGAARQDCGSNDDCAEGLRCEGRVNGVGSCIDSRFSPEGNQSQCTTSLDCPDSNGLVCAGENIGGGNCNPAWMRRHFHSESGATIEGETTSITLDSYGLATVHTDVSLDLFITHEDFSQLRVVLVNPTGTESVIHDQDGSVSSIYLDGEARRGFPGDEDANGTWTLRVENLDPTKSGSIYEFGLEITSRWD